MNKDKIPSLKWSHLLCAPVWTKCKHTNQSNWLFERHIICYQNSPVRMRNHSPTNEITVLQQIHSESFAPWILDTNQLHKQSYECFALHVYHSINLISKERPKRKERWWHYNVRFFKEHIQQVLDVLLWSTKVTLPRISMCLLTKPR